MKSELGSSLAYGLMTRLGQSIIIGEYDDSGFPTEAELCAEFKASRTVMREAIKMLAAKGLLVSRQRQGTQVTPADRWNLLDPDVLGWLMQRPFSKSIYRQFTQMRLAIEPVAASLASERQDKAAIADIRKGYQGMVDFAHLNYKSLEYDIDFHVAILHASGNPFFWRLAPMIENALRLSITLTNKIAGHTASLPAHEAVLVAIEQANAPAAEASLRAILHESLSLIEAVEV